MPAGIRNLAGWWLLLPAAVIEFYARRYEFAGLGLPAAVLVIACFAVLLAPQGRGAFCVGLLSLTGLVLAVFHPLHLVHLALVLLLLCAGLLAAWVSRILMAVLLASFGFLLIVYYAVLIIGRETWNQVVSRDLVLVYLRQAPDLVEALPIPQWLPYAAAAALFLGLLAAFAAVSRRIAGEVQALGRKMAVVSVLPAVLAAGLWGDTRDPLLTTLFVKQDAPGSHDMPFNLDERILARDRAVAASYPPRAGTSRKTLVLITVDGLRADQMGVYGHARDNTPFLSGLHKEGRLTRFDNVFAACTASLCGLLAIHNARFWHELGTVNFGLADALKRLGYHNQFLLSGDHANYYGLRRYYGHNIDDYRDASMAEGYVNDDSHVVGWLQRIAPANGVPRFVHVHLMSVHILGKRLPEYRRWYDPANPAYADKYHDGILQADALIAKVFAALRERGLLDDAVVAVTSDHGEALGGEERQFGHGGPPIDAVVRVPLLIFDSERFAYDKRPLASVTDVAPTLLDRIGAPIPEHWTGVSLARAGTRKYTLVQAQDRYAVIGSFGPDLYKYHYRVSDKAGELVRLGPGGSESKPLPPEAHAAVLQDLRGELLARIRQSP